MANLLIVKYSTAIDLTTRSCLQFDGQVWIRMNLSNDVINFDDGQKNFEDNIFDFVIQHVSADGITQ